MARLSRDWHALAQEQRVAAGAALALFVTMLLPWYQQNLGATVGPPDHETLQLQSRNLNAFQVFSFIEAAILHTKANVRIAEEAQQRAVELARQASGDARGLGRGAEGADLAEDASTA